MVLTQQMLNLGWDSLCAWPQSRCCLCPSPPHGPSCAAWPSALPRSPAQPSPAPASPSSEDSGSCPPPDSQYKEVLLAASLLECSLIQESRVLPALPLPEFPGLSPHLPPFSC